jgi:hypothetical protein
MYKRIMAAFLTIFMAIGVFGLGTPAQAAPSEPRKDVYPIVFVGGIGTLSGPVIGALLLIPLQQYFYLQFGNANLYLIAYGVLFILILRLLPGGIAPAVTGLWRRVLVARQHAAGQPAPAPAATPEAATAAVSAARGDEVSQ